ncbi:MAG: sugar phosphate isomerase/epimerase family protein [Candidatus Bathyarchaeia archaeon]
MERLYSVGLWLWGKLCDRFNVQGYRDFLAPSAAIKEARRIPKVSGVELTYPDNVNEENWRVMRDLLNETGLRVSSIYCNLSSDPKWQKGAFISEEKVLNDAIRQVQRTMDLAVEFATNQITFSLLQDGWDYPFQVDYQRAYNIIVGALQKCCDYRHDVSIGIEYKPREPRVFCFLATAPLVLLLIQEVQRENIGVVLDIGHALMAREGLGNVVALINRYSKLLHLHLNDNYGDWDDDLIVGTTHFLNILEFVFWLRKTNYSGWYGLDIFPFREDPVQAATASIEFLEACHNVIDRLGLENIEQLIADGNVPQTIRRLIQTVFALK